MKDNVNRMNKLLLYAGILLFPAAGALEENLQRATSDKLQVTVVLPAA